MKKDSNLYFCKEWYLKILELSAYKAEIVDLIFKVLLRLLIVILYRQFPRLGYFCFSGDIP